jgi:hypothetical protein
MTDPDDAPREPAPDDASNRAFPFGDFEVETETLPDGRQVHYYRWPDADPFDRADV